MRPAPQLVSTYLLFAMFIATGCVSVELNKSKSVTRNEEVKFSSPPRAFSEIKNADVDKAWQNKNNGNSISFISECGDGIDPTLENMYSGILKGVNDVQVAEKNKLNYNGRDALRAVVTGNVDGVSSKVDFLVFKKNGCAYVITYVGVASKFDENLSDFQKFLDGFVAP